MVSPQIGIGITTHNRNLVEHTYAMCKKHTKNAKIVIVDDASLTPCEIANYRFENNVGIAAAKNKCLELLSDCDYIFLFDDDCYPIKNGWHRKYIYESKKTGNQHYSFTFSKLFNGKSNGNNIINTKGNTVYYSNPCGCMLFYTKECIFKAGLFDESYGFYGYEHLDYSCKIFSLGLTENPYIDIINSNELFYSYDYYNNVKSSVNEKAKRISIENNKKIFFKRKQINFKQNNNYMNFSKYKLKDNIGELNFRDANWSLINITADNITDEKVEIAKLYNYGHCFVELSAVKKKDKPLTIQSLESLSTLNEVPTEGNLSLPAQPNKRDVLVTKKKAGRPPKSK
jgi:hypothetical protein